MTDTIYRSDAIEAMCMNDCGGCRPNECGAYLDKSCDVVKVLSALPSAGTSLKAIKRQIDEHWYLDPLSHDAVQGYTEWLEKIIVKEAIVWLCEDSTDKEWCEKNCNYASIQAECLRHLYEVSKGGDSE